MPSKALIILIAALSFCVVSSKPTVSRGNDGNGNFGYKYEVSHYPGSSRMYINTGGSSSNHQAHHNPYHDTNKHGEGGYIPYSPVPSEYRPKRYENDAKAPIEHSSHGPEIIHEPQSQYQSPYDSVSKNHYNDNNAYQGDGKPYIANDDYPLSVHKSPIPDERNAYIHHPNKDLHAPGPYPEYGNAPASQETINPHISQEHINPPISQEFINPHVSHGHANPHIPQEQTYLPVSQEHINLPVPQEYIDSPISHEYANPPVAQELVNPHSPQEPIYPPVSQEHVNPHIPQESISLPLSQEYINPPVQELFNHPITQEHVNPHIPQQPIYPPVSQEQVNPHVSQDHIDSPISQEYVNIPVSKTNVAPHIHQIPEPISVEYTNSPVKQDYIDYPISQDSINPLISQEYLGNPVISEENILPSVKQPYSTKTFVEPKPLEQVSVPTYDEPSKESEPVPVRPKYQFIPSGPPYVTNSHTTQIIHPPLPDSHNTGLVEESIDISPLIDEVKPASISHAFRLPIPALSLASSGPHIDQIEPENHSEDSHPVAPISHSTRLLLPSSGPSEESDVADLLPKSQLDVKSPGSFQNIADELSPFAPFPQAADLKSFQIEADVSGNAPASLEAAHHGIENDAPVLPPLSHAFRLNRPGVIPSLQLPPNPEVNPVEEKVSSALDDASAASSLYVPHAPRISHAFRLNLPSSQNHN